MSDDDFDVDLGIDEKESTQAVKKGINDGVKKGMAKGAADAMKDVSEVATHKAIDILMKGDSTLKSQQTLDNVRNLYEQRAFEKAIDRMDNANQKKDETQQQTVNPMSKLKELQSTLLSMGVNLNDLFEDKKMLVAALLNPDLLPLLLTAQDKPKGNSDLLTTMLMNRLSNPQPQPQYQPPQQNNDSLAALIPLIIKIMDNNTEQAKYNAERERQDFQMRMESERQHSQQILELTVKSLEPYMQQRSFMDDVKEFREKIAAFKEMGMMTDGNEEKDPELKKLEYEVKKANVDIQKKEMLNNFEFKKMEKEQELKDKDMEKVGKVVGMITKLFKNVPIDDVQQITQQQPADERSKREKISDKVTQIMKQTQKMIPDDDEDE